MASGWSSRHFLAKGKPARLVEYQNACQDRGRFDVINVRSERDTDASTVQVLTKDSHLIDPAKIFDEETVKQHSMEEIMIETTTATLQGPYLKEIHEFALLLARDPSIAECVEVQMSEECVHIKGPFVLVVQVREWLFKSLARATQKGEMPLSEIISHVIEETDDEPTPNQATALERPASIGSIAVMASGWSSQHFRAKGKPAGLVEYQNTCQDKGRVDVINVLSERDTDAFTVQVLTKDSHLSDPAKIFDKETVKQHSMEEIKIDTTTVTLQGPYLKEMHESVLLLAKDLSIAECVKVQMSEECVHIKGPFVLVNQVHEWLLKGLARATQKREMPLSEIISHVIEETDDEPTPNQATGAEKLTPVLSDRDFVPYLDLMIPNILVLGVSLGIGSFTEGVLNKPGRDDSKCLQVVAEWLRHTQEPTWSVFCEQLKIADCFKQLVYKIKLKHCSA